MSATKPNARKPNGGKPNGGKPNGGKPPVMMIHGAFCGPWSLDGLKAKFQQAGYDVVAPCLRFHDIAPSPAALGITGLADYAADLEQEIAGLGEPPVLVGHSMGGLLAQILAARGPVRALVLLAPSATWGVPPSTLFEISAAQAMNLNPGYWNQALEPSRDVALAHFLDKLPRDMRDGVFARLTGESGRATFEIMNWGLDMDRASEVDHAKVTCPVLLLTGSEDHINPPTTVMRIAALYRDSTNEVLPGVGHWLIGEPGWEALVTRTLSWLDEKL